MITNVLRIQFFFLISSSSSYCCYLLLSRKIKREKENGEGARKRDVIFHRQTFNSCSTDKSFSVELISKRFLIGRISGYEYRRIISRVMKCHWKRTDILRCIPSRGNKICCSIVANDFVFFFFLFFFLTKLHARIIAIF